MEIVKVVSEEQLAKNRKAKFTRDIVMPSWCSECEASNVKLIGFNFTDSYSGMACEICEECLEMALSKIKE